MSMRWVAMRARQALALRDREYQNAEFGLGRITPEYLHLAFDRTDILSRARNTFLPSSGA